MTRVRSDGGVRGTLIVFEGGEGSGKSTAAAATFAWLQKHGRETLLVREPGETAAGEQLRLLLRSRLAPWAEAFAFLAARAQLVHEILKPALGRGAIVVCDRFEASTFAYQGYGRGLDLAGLRAANEHATGGVHPALTVYLDVPPETGLARKRGEAEVVQTGREGLAFHERVREGYLALARDAPAGAWVTIDATRSATAVALGAREAVRRHLEAHASG